MSLQLPGELVWILNLLGYDWPDADEDKLHECATAWRNFAQSVEQTQSQGTSAANQVLSANSGEAIDGFSHEWGEFNGSGGSGDNYLRDAAAAAEVIAVAFDAAAIAVLAGKIAVIAQLVILAAEIIAAQAAAPFTFGLSEIGAAGATQATRVIVRQILAKIRQEVMQAATKAMEHATMDAIKKLAKKAVSKEARQLAMDYAKKTVKDTIKDTVKEKVVDAAKEKATEAGTEMAQNIVEQGIETHFGERDGIKLSETADIGKEKAGEYVDGLKEGADDLTNPKTYIDHAREDLTNRGLDQAQKHVDQRTGGAATRHQGVTDGAKDTVREQVRSVFG
ncbi:PE-PGRS family protein [Streptomyces sp. NRRL F-4489]|uniref:WXG100-like domain-containing protein n=1 Tax=Streptomyces sp. NRRL F-4489 TaxID=1609095 RepID=UPI000749189B|nr:PE-PGRS family protein [Streptomyces sp. NRRL F-4489]KUL37386.1 PE-PGRS family protein [Streptomyces sp. NRRL F-4489]